MVRLSTRSPKERQRRQDCLDREQALQRALARLDDTSSDHSIRQIAAEERVDRTTLARHFKGIQQGHKTAHRQQQRLTEGQEAMLAAHVQRCGRQFHPLSLREVRVLANAILQADEPDAKPVGGHWAQAFIQRHPQLRRSMSSAINASYIIQRHPDSAANHRDTLQAAMEEHGILCDQIYNMDETGFSLNEISRGKVVTDLVVNPSGRNKQMAKQDNVTVVETIRNSKETPLPLPAFLIFKGKVFSADEVSLNADYKGTAFMKTNTGFQSSYTMSAWLEFFDENTKASAAGSGGWRLLMMDGLGAHFDVNLWYKAWYRKISIVVLPPSCTGWLQPLDVAAFCPVKDRYKQMLESYSVAGASRFKPRVFAQRYVHLRVEVLHWGVVTDPPLLLLTKLPSCLVSFR